MVWGLAVTKRPAPAEASPRDSGASSDLAHESGHANAGADSSAVDVRSDWATFLRFVGVGGLNTAFGYFSYAAFVLAGAPLGLAVTGSTTLAFFFNFASYGGLVFGDTSYRLLPRFLAFYACLGGLNFLLLRALVWGGLGPLWAQALLLPVLACVGFFGMRRFVFHRGRPGLFEHRKARDGEV